MFGDVPVREEQRKSFFGSLSIAVLRRSTCRFSLTP